MSCIALEVEHLRVILGHRHIIRNVSLTVPGGATVALVGESGSGKTMTTMAVMGLLPEGMYRTGGRIVVDGQDVDELSPEQYRQIRNKKVAVVMQNPMSSFDPILNIFQHFRETLASHADMERRAIREKAEVALDEVGFADPKATLELYPFQMSGGMLQRVMLALALIQSPPLVIADEATSDLDVMSQSRILKLLKEHCAKRHLALLIITHDLSVAASMADEIVLMKDGELVEYGRTREFFKTPQTLYAKRLLELHRGLYTDRFLKITSNLVAEATS
ncbi:MAG: ABC transporter ATP-binding protein [Synergistaceae bacterium]|jgi:ABC-type glutathione transport system ATPase component|nr:ABC transporter ATP-binding protein [Synergistaceae bacterium]